MHRRGFGPSGRILIEPALGGLLYLRAERQLVAGLSQGGVQVGRRKPVIQGGPAREILSESPSAGCGRTETFANDAARPTAPVRLDPTRSCPTMRRKADGQRRNPQAARGAAEPPSGGAQR